MNINFRWLNKQLHSAQSGQVIILMAFGMVALLAVLGLAIDGGRLFYLERDAQNATDSAVLAATHALCSDGTDVIGPAVAAAATNGFVDNDDTVNVTVNNPPSIPVNTTLPQDSFVEVMIDAEIPSYFIQLVYGGDLSVQTYALAHCIDPWNAFTEGGALISTHMDAACGCNNAISVTGSTALIVGGIMSNQDIKIQGSHGTVKDGDAMHFCDPTVFGNNVTFENSNDVQFSPMIQVPMLYDITEYAPGGHYAQAAAAEGKYHYYSSDIFLKKKTYADVYATGGLIYVDGSIDLNGDFVSSGGNPMPVTIVATGSIEMNNSTIQATAYTDNHLLFFSLHGNNNCSNGAGERAIRVSTSTWALDGIIYAPFGHVRMPTSNGTLFGAIIGDTIDLPGSQAYIYYMPQYFPPQPPSIEITK